MNNDISLAARWIDIRGKEALNISNHTAYDKLTEAIGASSDGDTVLLLTDIELGAEAFSSTNKAYIEFSKSITLDGQGHSITSNALPENGRFFNITETEGKTFVFENINLDGSSSNGYIRGINIFDNSNATVVLRKSSITLSSYYAFNIGVYNTGLKVRLEDSSIKGWATIYNRSSGVELIAENCKILSVNPYQSGGDDNSFSSVIVAEYYDWNGSGESNENSFLFESCLFSATKTYPESDVAQAVFDIRSPNHNTLSLKGCEIKEYASEKPIKNAFDTACCSDLDKREAMKNTNQVIINGKSALESEYVENYLDE